MKKIMHAFFEKIGLFLAIAAFFTLLGIDAIINPVWETEGEDEG